MVDTAIVIMTALLPTTGHRDLIEFASRIADKTIVIIQARSFEPISGYDRVRALSDAFEYNPSVQIILDIDDNAPQNPDPTQEIRPGADKKFWAYWNERIRDMSALSEFNDNVAIVASESYGAILAKNLGCRFVPYDIEREINGISSTKVRNYIDFYSDKVLPEFKKYLKLNIVLFGQESVGKTTMAAFLTRDNINYDSKARFVPEYARGYLEAVGPEITPEKMGMIHRGQYALQQMAYDSDSIFNVFDTDLLSTIGYHRIFAGRQDEISTIYDMKIHPNLYDNVVETGKNHIYILLPDDVDFEPDPLRYGGDKRESTYEFWKNLLDQYGMKYYEVPRGLDFLDKVNYVNQVIHREWDEKIHPIKTFRRD